MTDSVKSKQGFLIYSQHECHLTKYRSWRQFDFHARLTKHKSSSETTEGIQKLKKKNETVHHSSYLQVFNEAITILAGQVLPSGIEPVPAFSLSFVGSQETFVNLCHITLPKDKRSAFKNYHSRSIFSKILQQTKRSTS